MSFKSRHARTLFLLTAILLLALARAAAQQYELCPKAYIVGREIQNDNAHSYLSSGTTDISHVEFYVTSVDSKLYLQSNYQPEGADYPIKLSADALSGDLKTWARTLVSFGGRLSTPRNFASAYENEATFYLDKDLFSDPKYSSFKLGRLSNAYVVDNSGGKWSAYIDQGVFVELMPKLFLKLPTPDDIGAVQTSLQNRLSQDQIKLLPLIIDELTIETAKQKLPAHNLLTMDSFSIEKLKEQLSPHRGKTVFVLGHFEKTGDRLVVSDAYGKQVFSVTSDQLRAIGQELGLKIFPLGCETAKASSNEGTLHPFNSVEVVSRFHDALSAANWAGFLQALAKDDLGIVITKSFVDGDARAFEANIVTRVGNPRVIGTMRFQLTDPTSTVNQSPTPAGAVVPVGAGVSSPESFPPGYDGGDQSGENTGSNGLVWGAVFLVLALGVVFGIVRARSQG
ncbi:MAG: hypothetical protein QOK48_855 [Blastocatellia bacterium]|jgi:hypothetical protein|nr:hypothetical protein [Blastocatellia bacterium]